MADAVVLDGAGSIIFYLIMITKESLRNSLLQSFIVSNGVA